MQRNTCSDYRHEMILMGLKRRLADPDLGDEEKEELETRIRQLEIELGME
jgi:hypothetical protein